jgi:uncharacterized protein (TIGR02722 family)
MLNKFHLMAGFLGLVALTGCSGETRVLTDSESADWVTAEISDQDFKNASDAMLKDVLDNELSGNKTYIMEVGLVKNDTMQKINTAELTDYMRKTLRRSGKVQLTNLTENASISTSRELADKAMMDKSTTMKNGTVVAPNTSLFGRISERQFIVDGKKKIEYTFSLSITDLKTGLEIWSDKKVITKLTDKNKQTW